MGKVLRAKIGQLMLLAIAPDVFHWVKFRRIRRQELQFNRPIERAENALRSDDLFRFKICRQYNHEVMGAEMAETWLEAQR